MDQRTKAANLQLHFHKIQKQRPKEQCEAI